LLATKDGGVILDCFAGGGSTLHAAQLHRRLWIGCDVGNPNAALARIATFFGTEEQNAPPNQLKKCFSKSFLEKVLQQNAQRRPRPIVTAGKLANSNVAADKYACDFSGSIDHLSR
jgi:DNA methylase